MRLEEIKNTTTWKHLISNDKFKLEFEKAVKKCCYFVKPTKLNVEVSNEKIILSYTSGIINRDLDCQFKIFGSYEFSLDHDNNLTINEVSGKLESNYGYDFNTTSGGKLITQYSSVEYDEDGIELSYQSYADKYLIDSKTFSEYENDLPRVIMEMYHSNLSEINQNIKKIGENARFLKRNRSKDNLGMVEEIECTLGKNNTNSTNKKYYFNTFLGTKADSPELIHVMNGFPFAIIEDGNLKFKDDYAKLGLTSDNYQNIARERFLRELRETRKMMNNNSHILKKYDVMIKRIEKELGINSKTI